MRFRIPRSLRARLLLVILIVVVIPLAGVGAWLTGSAARSGEALLGQRLDVALGEVTSEVGTRWVDLRSAMLDIAADTAMQRVLTAAIGSAPPKESGPALLVVTNEAMDVLATALASPLTLTEGHGPRTWSIVTASRTAEFYDAREGISVMVPVHDRAGQAPIGRLEARLTLESLVPDGAGGAAGVGALLHVIDRATGTPLKGLPFDPALMSGDRFQLGSEQWLVRRRTLAEPALVVAAAAPLAAYTLPFRDAARKGSLATLATTLAALALAVLMTRRVTHSLEELASATQAVAAGDFDRRVSELSDSEAGQVGRAFNTMTASLKTTLRQLSQREALVAVGEFAATLAHEIRNPLTSIRIDLQRVEEDLPSDSPLRGKLGRALREVRRLDQTVTGALRIARSGSVASELVDLRVPLRRATEVARPAFESNGATLDETGIGRGPLSIRGDAAALEQLFLNILLNAAQALGPRGNASVAVTAQDENVLVAFRDSGHGIPADSLARVFEPFYTTKAEGTGLGLSVARQIVAAHGGAITIESTVGSGTSVLVRFPRRGGFPGTGEG